MNWAWTWSGHCFGYWVDRNLWTYSGKHVGHREGLVIYGPTGRYLGEIMGNDRLAINKAKAAQFGSPFVPLSTRDSQAIRPDQGSLPMYTGFDDFRHPDQF